MKQPLSILIACVLLTGCTHTEPPRASMNRRFNNRIEQSKATSRDKPKSTVNYIDLGTVPAVSKLANTPAPPEIQPRTATISVPKPKPETAGIQLKEFSTASPKRIATGYYKLRWRAQITNTGSRPISGHVWLGGTDKDGFTESQLCAHSIDDLPAGQTSRFSAEATLTDDEVATYKKWVINWHGFQ